MSKTKLIALQSICHCYNRGGQDVRCLVDIDLTVGKGEFAAITGPSGSGKTTLLHIMGCLLRPTRGTYLLNGIETEKLPGNRIAALRNKTFGFVFQNFGLLPRASLLWNVRLPHQYSRMTRRESISIAKELLALVGLQHRMKHRPNELSGGEQQRAAIARALANRPQVLLADEPTGNLDSANSKMILDLFIQMVKEGITVVLVTHNMNLVSDTDLEIRLNDGKIMDIRKGSIKTGETDLHSYPMRQNSSIGTEK